MSGEWEKIQEKEHFAYLRLLVRALGVSHEALANRLGLVRPEDVQKALHGRRELSADEIAIELLDVWRACRQKYIDAARYMDSFDLPD